MARFFVIFFGLLVFQQCSPRSLPEEESVVSVYTTQATTAHHQLDVYHQIASNIAERLTSPIYRFLGIGKNNTESSTTKASWHKIEILDDPEEESKPDLKPVNNDISQIKDVEELSTETLNKIERKPEKLTLFSSYLPSVSAKIEANDTINEVNDDDDDIETFGFDDDEDEDTKGRDSPFVYFFEIIGSFFQLLYGGIVALFSSNPPKS